MCGNSTRMSGLFLFFDASYEFSMKALPSFRPKLRPNVFSSLMGDSPPVSSAFFATNYPRKFWNRFIENQYHFDTIGDNKSGEVMITMGVILKLCYSLLLLCATLTGCDEHIEPEITSYLETVSEIPQEIWGQLDEETRNALAEGTKYVALTFDDGPRYETTQVLLDGLKERGAQATFFVIGTQILCSGNSQLLERMVKEGHQIGNHTYSHERLLSAHESIVIEEIQKNNVILKNLLGEEDYWLRPPYGLIDSSRAKLVETPMIYWTLDPEDWKWLDAKKVVELVVENIKAGDIVLLHDFYPSSVEAALEIIDALQPEGYVFVTVKELFNIYGVTPEDGILYASPENIRPLC